jgi:integrase
MPWRKYTPKEGNYGLIYNIESGVSVRQDARGKWTLFIEKGALRKSCTFDFGRKGLVDAIKAGEAVAKELSTKSFSIQSKEPQQQVPDFITFSNKWFEGNTQRWSPYTVERYESVIRLHLTTHPLFKKPVDQINRKALREYLRQLAKEVSPASVETIHGVISAVFNEASEDELVAGNPANGLLKLVLPPKKQRDLKPAEPFNQGELIRFLDHAPKVATAREVMMLKVMAYAGLRLGEMLAMRYRNIDFSRCTYHVVKASKEKDLGHPKRVNCVKWICLGSWSMTLQATAGT